MQSDDEAGGRYVRRVYDDTRRFTQDLLAENERLRGLVVGLQGDCARLDDELRAAREELERSRRERERAERSLVEIEAENRDFSARYVEVETHNCNLMNLYVAMLRLHGTLRRDEVLAVTQDIVVNVLGSEELALLLIEGRELRLLASTGIDAAAWTRVALGQGVVGRVALTGQAFLGGAGEDGARLPAERTLSACVPVTRVGEVRGVIAVFRLLRHKPALETFDHELLRLLGTQVGMALHASAAVDGGAAEAR